jgi:hypothetical protein
MSEQRPVPPAPPDGGRRSLRPSMTVNQELTFERFLGDTYLDVEDQDDLIERALDAMRIQGVDPSALGLNRDVLRALVTARRATAPAGPVQQPVQPQARRQERRRRLNESSRTVAARICQALNQRPGGRRIAALGGTGAPDNLGAVIIMMNRAVNRFLGIPVESRDELSADQLERTLAALDIIGDQVESQIRERLN